MGGRGAAVARPGYRTGRAWLCGLLACAVAAALPAAAPAALSSVPDNDWVTNGPVTAIARSGSTIYLGGSFSQVGPRTGPAVTFTGGSSTPDASFPQVSGGQGLVNAAISDGAGGWYLAGSFSRVGSVARAGLAHVLSGGSVDPSFAPSLEVAHNASAAALALSGSTLYVGGHFSAISGVARSGVAALNTSDGSLQSWNPGPSAGVASVETLAVSAGVLYVGGSFTEMGGQPRASLAAFTTSTGALTSWAPQATGTFPTVKALAISGSTIYLGGYFDHVAGQPRAGFSAVDTTGTLGSWNPEASGCSTPGLALAASGTAVYVSGCFTHIGGQARAGFAALDPTNGSATSWDPATSGGTVEAIVASGATIYASGSFTHIGGKTRNGVAALDATTAEASSWNPNLNLNPNPTEATQVTALAFDGTRVFVGGSFSSAGGLARSDLAAIDATTGEATAWNPGLTPVFTLVNQPVRALSVAGGAVYVGGSFSAAGGQPRANLAALDPVTGAATSWNPGATSASAENSVVGALLATPSVVYVGGSFTTLGGSPRANLGAVSVASGLATSWNPPSSVVKATSEHGVAAIDALALSGSTLYAGGGLTAAGGHARTGAAAFSTETGEPSEWNPVIEVFSGTPYASGLAVATNTVYVAAGPGGLLAVDPATGAAQPWRPTYPPASGLGSGVPSVAAANGAVYLPGAALDAASGLALGWGDPLSSFSFGSPTTAAKVITSGNHVYLAGAFRTTEYAPASGFAAFTITGALNTAPPTITGAAAEGQLLTEHHGGWSTPPTSYTYQWLRCPQKHPPVSCTPISEATGPTYTASAADLGSTIEVQEIATNGEGSSDPVGSAPTAVVYGPPENLTPPSITGTPAVGQTLSCLPGSWTNSPTGYHYAWHRDGEPITGATTSGYTVTAADAGHDLTCEVTASNLAGSRWALADAGVVAAGSGEEEALKHKHDEEAAAARKAEEEAAAGRKRAEEATAARKHEEELAASRKHEEEAATASKPTSVVTPGTPTVTIARAKRSGRTLLLTLTLSQPGTVTISGPGLKKTTKALPAGTHQLKVALTKAARSTHKKIKVTVSVRAATGAVSSSRWIKL
jgi:hypothetical protein